MKILLIYVKIHEEIIKIHNDALDKGYNVVRAEIRKIDEVYVIQDKPRYCRTEKKPYRYTRITAMRLITNNQSRYNVAPATNI